MVQVEAVSFLRHMGCNPSDGRPTQPDTVPVAEVHSKVLARVLGFPLGRKANHSEDTECAHVNFQQEMRQASSVVCAAGP